MTLHYKWQGNFLDDKTETVMVERESVKKGYSKKAKNFLDHKAETVLHFSR